MAENRTTLMLEIAINEAIDELCKESGYTIDYLEINTALITILSRNHQRELFEFYKEKE